MDFIIFIVGLFLGYHLGQMVLSWRLRDIILKEARREGLNIDDEYNVVEQKDDKPNVAQLFIERANDIMYLYDRKANTFICQATSMDELAKLAKEYKNIKYAAVLDQSTEDVFAFVDGKVKHDILAKTHES
jgi:hypothetical protein